MFDKNLPGNGRIAVEIARETHPNAWENNLIVDLCHL